MSSAPKKTNTATKIESESRNLADFYMNPYEISDELKQELTKKGLEWRFINAVKFKEMGYHRSRWVPYRTEKGTISSPADQVFGADPEGFVRRGSDILACKPKAAAQAHREHLRKLTRLQESSHKSKAEQIKSLFKESGIKGQVHEGYDDNGEGAED
jgi:hypothetical protein